MIFLHTLICSLLIISGFLVVFSTNPVQSVLFLIATFCSAGSILILFHSEFFGLVFIIVYVGAIAVLFLFVIMMLNVKNTEETVFLFNDKRIEFLLFISTGYFLLVILSNSISKIFTKNNVFFSLESRFLSSDQLENLEVLGQVLYNYYFICFLLAGIILLVALLGAIVLTLKFNEVKKSQLSTRQLSRSDKFLSFF